VDVGLIGDNWLGLWCY